MSLYEIFKQHPVITTDSRNCPCGSIFFALKGEMFDGNQYALSALEKGCSYAVVEKGNLPQTSPLGEGLEERLIFVDSPLTALQDLAREHRRALGTTIIGVTGTNGKTTTKELIATVLSRKFKTLYTQGNFNNHIGVPKTLLSLTPDHEIAVVEMGANHPGEIKTLVNIVEPDYGIITNVGKAHLEGFGSFEGVIRTKGELYDFLRSSSGSQANSQQPTANSLPTGVFINENNPHLMGISSGLNLVKYGKNGRLISSDPFLRLEFEGRKIQTRLIGAYNIDNALAAATIGQYFGVPVDDICAALEEYTPSNNRSQFKKTEKNSLIIDAYNANPTSMMAALENFAAMKAERKMCILGAMRELGEASAEEHQRVLDYLDAHFSDLWLVGEEWKSVNHPIDDVPCLLFNDIDAVKSFLTSHPQQDKTILIKGSNSTHLIDIVPML